MRDLEMRAAEIADFLGADFDYVKERLESGFHANHALVAKDFTDNNTDVNDDESLLNWYRETDSYIYELTAYHLDERFNYSGMCDGIVERCIAYGALDVLCLGDGIGDLTFRLIEAHRRAVYHDLAGGKNADYAYHVFPHNQILTSSWDPSSTYIRHADDAWGLIGPYPEGFGSEQFDAVVALDFFEHLMNVEEWAITTYECLRYGGGFLAQNAFAIGDAEHGNSIPMHLSVNNKYETEWATLMQDIGFTDNVGGWWIK